FFPREKIEIVKDAFDESKKSYINTLMEEKENVYDLSVLAKIDSKECIKEKSVLKGKENVLKECELQLATALYEVLSDLTGYKPPWGLLTGVRPAKLMLKLLDELGDEGALKYFEESLKVGSEKALLAREVAVKEKKIINGLNKKGFSLYVSIPFCPSRCGYCSFVSHSISNSKARKSVDEYMEKLLEELKYIASISKKLDLKAQTVYFGGGTPTSLNNQQLQNILSLIESEFDLSGVVEYCVEAGRPDTVDFEKLKTLKKYGVNRISINPQTFNDRVLENIKRGHDAQKAVEAYKMAQSIGFDTVNMDLIAGLPGDNLESFKYTVDKTLELNPDNITVHTLALKRASDLTHDDFGLLQAQNVAKMLEYVSDSLRPAGYAPYYMYR
ncbi:MAG TPA: coproporphyrinogen dehydrogenase HemZ, partial [Oscillospiraceae bacterium]|nr:coproporphyrinogen dehydrogenase HemZ [Oscillospiraceae bacterium]